METEKRFLSNAFTVFSKEAPDFAVVWMKLVQELSGAILVGLAPAGHVVTEV